MAPTTSASSQASPQTAGLAAVFKANGARTGRRNGRAWQLWLTPAGRAALAETRTGLTELNARLTEGFTDAEIDVVARWLTSLQTKFPTGDEQ